MDHDHSCPTGDTTNTMGQWDSIFLVTQADSEVVSNTKEWMEATTKVLRLYKDAYLFFLPSSVNI